MSTLAIARLSRLSQRRERGSAAPIPTRARGAGLLGVANVVIAVVWT